MEIIFTENNLVRSLIPTTEGVIFTATEKVILKHFIIVNDNDDKAKIYMKIGSSGNELPFIPELKIHDDGFFQWNGWEVLEIGHRILMKSKKNKTYIHIAGASLT